MSVRGSIGLNRSRGRERVALTGSERTVRLRRRLPGRDSWAQPKIRILDAEHLLAQRLAGTHFRSLTGVFPILNLEAVRCDSRQRFRT